MLSIPYRRILVAFAGYVLLCMPRAASAYPSYSVNDVTVREGNTGTTTATFTVTRSETGAATVTYQTITTATAATEASGACGGASDYLRTSGTLSFSTNERSKTINVPICPDYTPEKDELFLLYVGKNHGKCTILNDDSPNITITDSGDTEGNSSSGTARFYVRLSTSPAVPVTVWYDVRTITDPGNVPGWARPNDTATSGTSCGTPSVDYIGRTGQTVQFSVGDREKIIDVQLCPDTTPEPTETFSVILTRAEGAIIMDNNARGDIINDDLPVLTVGDVNASEPPNEGWAQCTLRLSSTNHSGCRISYRAVAGSATLSTINNDCSTGSDLVNISGTVEFRAGDDFEDIGVPICDDTLREGTETFQIQFSSPVGLSAPDLVANCTIADND